MITQKYDQVTGKPWRVKLGKFYVGSYATFEIAQAAEKKSTAHHEETGQYLKIKGIAYIKKRWKSILENDYTLDPANFLTRRSPPEQKRIDRAKQKAIDRANHGI